MIRSDVGLEISAAILAGGRARRLGGADKAALLVGDARIIDRQLDALAGLTDDVRIVANDRTRYADLRLPVVADAIPEAGALGGIYTALIHARHERVIVLACDLPFVTGALLARLELESRAEEIDAVVPRTARGLEPLCAVYRKRCAGALRARIDRGALQVAAALNDVRVQELGAAVLAQYDDGSLFENINTPHDYARARDRVALNEKPFEDRITE